MSTKIYNGFQINTTNVFEIHQALDEVFENARAVARANVERMMARECARILDEVHHGLKPELRGTAGFTAYGRVWEAFVKRWEDNKRGKCVRDSAIDWNFEVTLFPLPESESNATPRVMGMYFVNGFGRALAVGLMSHKLISEYAYWNNVDPLETVTEDEWKQRGEDWEAVLGWSPPSCRGYTRELWAGCESPVACLSEIDAFATKAAAWVLEPDELQARRLHLLARKPSLADAVDAVELASITRESLAAKLPTLEE